MGETDYEIIVVDDNLEKSEGLKHYGCKKEIFR
jgi:hypothetical protein